MMRLTAFQIELVSSRQLHFGSISWLAKYLDLLGLEFLIEPFFSPCSFYQQRAENIYAVASPFQSAEIAAVAG